MRTPKLLVIDGSDTFVRQVERAVNSLRPRPEVVHAATIEATPTLIQEQGPFDIMIGGPVMSSEEGMSELRRLHLQSPQTSLILAFDRWRSGTLRQTVRTGAMDILRLPASDSIILESIEQALDIRWGAPLHVPTPDAPRRDGAVIVVGSAAGGCGKTFFATNLAYHLQSRLNQRTCLIDLDLQFGELSTALRLKPRHTISDLLAGSDVEDDRLAAHLEDTVVRHETGISVLAAPEGPAEADAVGPSDVARVIIAAQSRFDTVVVDTPASLNEVVLAAIEMADQIFSIATLDLPSVRNLGVLLTTLKQLKIPSERVHLVLNKVERDVGIDVAAVSRYFPQGFSAVIPYGREANRSLNMGVPILAFAPRSDVSRALTTGFGACLQVDGASPDAGVEPRRRRLGRRSERTA